MSRASGAGLSWGVALRLGRVSNLPTVWSNVLAGLALAGGAAELGLLVVAILVALSLFYVGGMYLNDAFDATIDAAERPERPIPSGAVSRATVFALGFGMLGAGLAILAGLGLSGAVATGLRPAIGGLALAAAIVLYDWRHKANPLSPLVMGLCRVLVYVTAGLCVAVPLPAPLWIGAALILCHLIGLTYVAKQETLGRVENLWPLIFLAAPVVYGAVLAVERPVVAIFWLVLTGWIVVALRFVQRRGPGDIPRAVVSLIAGISLLDAMLIAGTGALGLAGVALVAFVVTLVFQRAIPGT